MIDIRKLDLSDNQVNASLYSDIWLQMSYGLEKAKSPNSFVHITDSEILNVIAEKVRINRAILDSTMPIEQFVDIFIDEWNREYPEKPILYRYQREYMIKQLSYRHPRVGFIPKVIGPRDVDLKLDPNLKEGIYLIPIVTGGYDECKVDGDNSKADLCDDDGNHDLSVQEQSESSV